MRSDGWKARMRRSRVDRTESVWADMEKEIPGQKNAATAYAEGEERSDIIMRETTMLIMRKESGRNVKQRTIGAETLAVTPVVALPIDEHKAAAPLAPA